MTVRFIFATIKKDIHIKKASHLVKLLNASNGFTYQFQKAQQQMI